MIIGIGGISRSGKTTLARYLTRKLPGKTVIVHIDDYIKDSSHWDFFTRYPVFYLSALHYRFNMEHPHTIDFATMHHDIEQLRKKYNNIIIEGFLASYYPAIRSIIDKYIHVQISYAEFIERRMKDYKKNNRWYANHVWKSYEKYGNTYQSLPHLVLDADQNLDCEKALEFLINQEGPANKTNKNSNHDLLAGGHFFQP